MKVIFIMLCLFFTVSVSAKEIGVVMLVRGAATNQKNEQIKVASKVNEGDQIETSPGAYVKIVMNDRNIVILTEKSKLKFDEYIDDLENKKVKITLTKGSARHVVNETYNKAGQYYEVKTAVAVAGVRGTDFITEYNDESGDTILCALKGIVSFDLLNDAPENKPVLVAAGNFIRFKKTDTVPQVIETKKQWLEKALQLHSLEEEAAFVPQINFNSQLQFWYTDDSTPAAVDNRNNFRPRRAEFKISGTSAERVRSFASADIVKSLATSGTTVVVGDNKVLQDLGIGYKLSQHFEFLVGQFKVLAPSESLDSSAELLFPERSIVARTFGDKRDAGLQLAYKTDDVLAVLMLSNGQGTNVNDTNTDKDVSFRVDAQATQFLSLGGFGLAKESNYNQLAKFGLNAAYISQDWLAKAEFANGYDANIRSQSQVFDLGYFLNSDFQLAGRFENYQPDMAASDTSSSGSLGLNYYIEKQKAKIQLMHSVLKNFSGNYGSKRVSNGSDGALTVLAFQALF